MSNVEERPEHRWEMTEAQRDQIAKHVRETYAIPDVTIPPEIQQFIDGAFAGTTSADPTWTADMTTIQKLGHGILLQIDASHLIQASFSVETLTGKDLIELRHAVDAQDFVNEVLGEAPGMVARNNANSAEIKRVRVRAIPAADKLDDYVQKLHRTIEELRERVDKLDLHRLEFEQRNRSTDAGETRPAWPVSMQNELAAVQVARWTAETTLEQMKLLSGLADLESTTSSVLHSAWQALALGLQKFQIRRKSRLARRQSIRRALKLTYGVVTVLAGVSVDAGLGETEIAGIAASAAAGLTLWAIDQRIIAPLVDTRMAQQSLNDLKQMVASATDFLVQLRQFQAIMHPVASRYGVKLQNVIAPQFLR